MSRSDNDYWLEGQLKDIGRLLDNPDFFDAWRRLRREDPELRGLGGLLFLYGVPSNQWEAIRKLFLNPKEWSVESINPPVLPYSKIRSLSPSLTAVLVDAKNYNKTEVVAAFTAQYDKLFPQTRRGHTDFKNTELRNEVLRLWDAKKQGTPKKKHAEILAEIYDEVDGVSLDTIIYWIKKRGAVKAKKKTQ